MTREVRALQAVFATEDAFLAEHTANLSKGGTFVPGATGELRERVSVDLVLEFCQRHLRMRAEIVHVVPPELAESGATPGVAVQFSGTQKEVAERLQPLVDLCGEAPPEPDHDPRRSSPRMAARVFAHVRGENGEVPGRTRNLSRGGVLLDVPTGSFRVGERVRVTLEHPTSGQTMEVDARIAREVEKAGELEALGIAFEPDPSRQEAIEAFVEDVQSSEHTRRIGSISGPLEELGTQNLLRMLGTSSPAGTLVLKRGQDEGVIGFEGGILRFVHAGKATGLKALTRLMRWETGTYEFHAQLENAPQSDAPLPLAAAIEEAARLLDETDRLDDASIPREARVVVGGDAAPSGCKLEEAVLDLAGAGFRVERILEVIPEPDADILAAIASLADCGAVRLER